MKIPALASDKLAISLSMLCLAHCLIVPMLLVLLPAISVLPLPEESFHLWMVFAVVPISAYALTLGCKKHHNRTVILIGVIGLLHLVLAALLNGILINEVGEKSLTLIGTVLISWSHYQNVNLGKAHKNCPC